jgi:hypothetical protein
MTSPQEDDWEPEGPHFHLHPNGDFTFQSESGDLTIEGKFTPPLIGGDDWANNDDKLTIHIKQSQRDDQVIEIVGGSLEIPDFLHFVKMLAANMGLREENWK